MHGRDPLMNWQPPGVSVGYGPEVTGRGSLENKIARIIGQALRDARDEGINRASVARAMSDYLGRPVSEAMLNKWSSEASEDHRIPLTYKFIKPARPVRRVFHHCSASDNPAHDSVAVIDRWHKEKGWAGCGYHFFIRRDGTLELGRDLEKTPAAQEGNNTGSIAICLHGLSVEKFTDAQFATRRNLCAQIERAYLGAITFHGHCEVAKKTCPVFDYRKVLGLNANGQMPVSHAASPSLPVPPAASEIEVLANSVSTLRPSTP